MQASQHSVQQITLNKGTSTNWQSIAATNTSGFNAHPAGHQYWDAKPTDGDSRELWKANHLTFSIREHHRLIEPADLGEQSVR